WGALRQHRLQVQYAGEDPVPALEAVLDDWLKDVIEAEEAGDWESSARVSVPSRDTAIANALYSRGFAPVGVRRVRLRPRHVPDVAPELPLAFRGGRVRLATLDDADALGE